MKMLFLTKNKDFWQFWSKSNFEKSLFFIKLGCCNFGSIRIRKWSFLVIKWAFLDSRSLLKAVFLYRIGVLWSLLTVLFRILTVNGLNSLFLVYWWCLTVKMTRFVTKEDWFQLFSAKKSVSKAKKLFSSQENLSLGN